jgi:hypothetical protein
MAWGIYEENDRGIGVLSQHLPKGNEENHASHRPGRAVSRPKFQPRVFLIGS